MLQLGLLQGGLPRLTFVEVRHTGGVISKVDPHENAFGSRSETLLMECAGITPTPEAFHAAVASVDEFKSALQEHLSPGLYMNFLEGEEAVRRTAQGYLPESYARLKAVKAGCDPENLYCFSYDIPPEP